MAVTVEDEKLSKFLETFPTPLHHKQPESCDHFWVFWSQDEGSQIRSSSTDLGTRRIHEKLKSAFSKAIHSEEVVVQFWAPVTTIWGRRLLSTSGQPFAVSHLDKGLEKYRLRSLEYQYNINVNNELDIDEEDPDTMIISGAPVTAFLNRHPEMVDVLQGKRVHQRSALTRYALECGLETSCMLPIFCPSQSSSCCIGVVEYSISLLWPGLEYLKQMNRALEEVGLRMFHVRELIPYQTIDGLKHARDEIEKALKIICPSHNISLAQVWIAYEYLKHWKKEEGNQWLRSEDYVTPLEMRCKTTPIPLPREVIEQQFGNTMKEAAENLKVSLSTLKRKCKALGISEWQGPNLVKKKVYDSNNNQNNGALQDPLAVNLNDNTLTLKVECADDMIKFHLHISQATFVTVGREIGKKFKLALGSYKLKYYDEDGDWILLTSDQDMSDCIKSYRNSDQDVIRLQVVLDTESEPSGSYEISCT